jgi:hypothetical protein
MISEHLLEFLSYSEHYYYIADINRVKKQVYSKSIYLIYNKTPFLLVYFHPESQESVYPKSGILHRDSHVTTPSNNVA